MAVPKTEPHVANRSHFIAADFHFTSPVTGSEIRQSVGVLEACRTAGVRMGFMTHGWL
jgi:hypothetical protein